MIDLAQIEDKVLARLNAISAEELERHLRTRGYEVEVIERETETQSFFTFEYKGEYESQEPVVYLTPLCGNVTIPGLAVNSNELALAA